MSTEAVSRPNKDTYNVINIITFKWIPWKIENFRHKSNHYIWAVPYFIFLFLFGIAIFALFTTNISIAIEVIHSKLCNLIENLTFLFWESSVAFNRKSRQVNFVLVSLSLTWTTSYLLKLRLRNIKIYYSYFLTYFTSLYLCYQ